MNHAGEDGTGEAVDSPGEAGSTRGSDGRSTGSGPGLAKPEVSDRMAGDGDNGDGRRCVGDAWDASGTCDGANISGLGCSNCAASRSMVSLCSAEDEEITVKGSVGA